MKTPTKPRRGRPPRAGKPATAVLRVRLTERERHTLDRRASARNQTTADAVREALRAARLL